VRGTRLATVALAIRARSTKEAGLSIFNLRYHSVPTDTSAMGLLLEVASDVPAIMAWQAWKNRIEILSDVTRTNTKHQRKVHIR